MAPARTEFVVVGAGLLGLATARALRRRGRDVLVLERATVGHERSGSKGASRIFRLGYDDARYVRMAMDARPLWKELEAEGGRQLLAPTGQLTFGAGTDALFRAMRDAGAPVQEVSHAEAQARFPEIAVPGDALFEPDSAVIDATATLAVLRASVDDAIREHTEVLEVADDTREIRVTTQHGDVHANVAVLCPGPWSARLASLPTFATLEHIAYFRHRSGAQPPMPILIEFGEPAAYGLPTAAVDAYKLAFHHAGPVVDPDTTSIEPQSDAIDAIARVAARLFPSFDPTPVFAETCMYDNTANEDFVLERRGNVVVGAGTSGHGFKFGPLLGERLADLAMRS